MTILHETLERATALKDAVVREVKRPPITTDTIHASILNLFGLYQQAATLYEDTLTRYGVVCQRDQQRVTLSLPDIQLQVGYDKDAVPFELCVLPRTEKPLLPKDTEAEGVCLPLNGGVYRVVGGISIIDKDTRRTLAQLNEVLDTSQDLLQRFT